MLPKGIAALDLTLPRYQALRGDDGCAAGDRLESILVSENARLIPTTNSPMIQCRFNHDLLFMRLYSYACATVSACMFAWPAAALADTWYYVSLSADAKRVDQQCVRLPGDTTPAASLSQHASDISILSDKTTADQSRVLVLASRTGSKYAFTSTVKACQAFRAPILAEASRRKVLDMQQWYVAQLTRGDCVPIREMFGGVTTPEALHRQMTKDGTPMSLERRGDSVRLISFDRQNVPPLHLVKGEGMCEDYVRR